MKKTKIGKRIVLVLLVLAVGLSVSIISASASNEYAKLHINHKIMMDDEVVEEIDQDVDGLKINDAIVISDYSIDDSDVVMMTAEPAVLTLENGNNDAVICYKVKGNEYNGVQVDLNIMTSSVTLN